MLTRILPALVLSMLDACGGGGEAQNPLDEHRSRPKGARARLRQSC